MGPETDVDAWSSLLAVPFLLASVLFFRYRRELGRYRYVLAGMYRSSLPFLRRLPRLSERTQVRLAVLLAAGFLLAAVLALRPLVQ